MGNLFKGMEVEKQESELTDQMRKQCKNLNEKFTEVCNDVKETLNQIQDINNRILALEQKTHEIETNVKIRDNDGLLPNSESLSCLKLTHISKKIKKEQIHAPKNKKVEASRLLNARIRHKEARMTYISTCDNSNILVPSKIIGQNFEELGIKPPIYAPILQSGGKNGNSQSQGNIDDLLEGSLDFSNIAYDQVSSDQDNCMEIEQELTHCGVNVIQNIRNELSMNADTACF